VVAFPVLLLPGNLDEILRLCFEGHLRLATVHFEEGNTQKSFANRLSMQEF
jgi:hypothetical protein